MLTKTLAVVAAAAAVAVAAPASPAAAAPGSSASIQNMREKIKNVVVLIMENRSADNLLGGQLLAGFSNPIQDGPFCNPVNVTDPSQGQFCSKPKEFDSVTHDPNHSNVGNNMEFYGTWTPDNQAIKSGKLTPTMQGFVDEQTFNYAGQTNESTLAREVLSYYTEAQVPVITELCKNYVVFNNWHSDIAGATNPNRLAITSGTSRGTADNNFGANSMPQKSIFQQLTSQGIEWLAYAEDDSIGDVLWYEWIWTHNKNSLVTSFDNFFDDAATGSLRPFSYLVPSCCGVGSNSMHPSGLVSDGEKLIKNVYDSLRSSPQWEETLFIISFDESGGFHDHIPPPLAPRPDDFVYETTAPNGQNYTYDFNRVGGRLPTWLISGWVTPMVEQMGTNSDGATVSYHATSILRTLGYLFNFEPFNPRVEAAPSFDHLIGKTFRDDTPTELPAPIAFKPASG